MIPRLINARYERKYVSAPLLGPDPLAVIRGHAAALREAYPARLVHNIYLDTPARRDLGDHLDGVSSRSKTRIRWYGDACATVSSPTLELKSRLGLVGGKHVFPLAPLDLSPGVLARAVAECLAGSDLSEGVRRHASFLEPALVNRYLRRYFESRDHLVRVTIDTTLDSWDCRRWTPSDLSPARRGRGYSGVVIELKYRPESAGAAATIASGLPWPVARFSKYVWGMGRGRSK
jgi:hypothetical protein